MLSWQRFGYSVIPPALVLAALGCGEPPNGPGNGGNNGNDNAVASVTVTSPIGDKMARGRQLQLTATAMNAAGDNVTTSFTWMSSNDAVATVSGSGLVDGLAAGPATITAAAENVSGNLAITVVDADLSGIATAAGDAYAASLVGGLPSGSASALDQILSDCMDAAGVGHILNLEACIAAARSAMASPATPDETVLFTYLGLYVDHVERLLNLE